MFDYYHLLKPYFFKCDPETIHHRLASFMKLAGSFPLNKDFPPTNLTRTYFGHTFHHPVGLAAGFDKNAEMVPFMRYLGFSFVEVGSISALPSVGNPKPRLFRLTEDESLINRMGLNNHGVDVIKARLAQIKTDIPVGVNIAKTHSEKIMGDAAILDFLTSYKALADAGAYITLNISCPNTKEGKTFEDPTVLRELLSEVVKVKARPTLVKFSPDLSEDALEELVGIVREFDLAGLVLGNTTRDLSTLKTSETRLKEIGAGGLSGPVLFEKNLRLIKRARQGLHDEKVIIGVGGINSPEKASLMLEAGANLLQLYTGFIYNGPMLIHHINQSLLSK